MSAVTAFWNQNTKGMSFKCLEEMIKFLDDIQEYQDALVQAYSNVFKTIVYINLSECLRNALAKKIIEVIVPVLEGFTQRLNVESKMIDKDLAELMQRESIKKYFEHLVRATDTDVKETGMYLFVVLKKLHNFEGNGHERTFVDVSQRAMSFWIKEATSKAMICVERAVDLDNFIQIDENVRYSSSAVDFLGILKELQIFWSDISDLNEKSKDVDTKMFQAVTKVIQLFIYLSIKKFETFIESKGLSESYLNLWITFIHNINHIKQSLVENLLPDTLKMQKAFLKDIFFELKVDKGFAVHLVSNIQHDMGIDKCVDELLYDELKVKYESMFATLSEEFKNASDFKELCKEIWDESLNFFDQIVDKAIEVRKSKNLSFFLKAISFI